MSGNLLVTVAYTVITEGCTFLLDQRGICRSVLLREDSRSASKSDSSEAGRTRPAAAKRCIGAQYVASIDVRVKGVLVSRPRVGVPMLFAETGPEGQIALIRTGRVVHFEAVSEFARPATTDPSEKTWTDARPPPIPESGERVVGSVDATGRHPGADASQARRTSRLPPPPPPPRRPPAAPIEHEGKPRRPKMPTPPPSRDLENTLTRVMPGLRPAAKRAAGR